MIACVRVLNFALRLELLERPDLDGRPLVLSPAQGERRRVLDCTPEAAALYIRPGMLIRDVVALSPAAIVIEANPAREAGASRRILTALEAVSPLVEPDPQELGCWYVDLHGLERLAGPLPEIAQHLLRLMPPLLRPRVGIANGKFPARVAAGRAAPGAFQIVPPAETTTFLATEPVTTLPSPLEMIHLLNQLGLNTLGRLAALPPAAVAARMGPAGRQAWELARGEDPSAVQPGRRREVINERMELPAPTASRDTLLFALRLLVQRASQRPSLRGRGARQALIRVIFENGGSWEKRVAMRDPAQGDRLAELLRLRFQTLELPQPVAEVELELTDLSREAVYQETLAGLGVRYDRPLIEAARQLKSRYETSPLFRVVEVEPWSRIPERRHALMPFDP